MSEEKWKQVEEWAEAAEKRAQDVRRLAAQRLWNPTYVCSEFLDRYAYSINKTLREIADEEEGE